ncbi:MAG: hypothetical protein AAB407_00070 [Patescibacteria group bacterium]
MENTKFNFSEKRHSILIGLFSFLFLGLLIAGVVRGWDGPGGGPPNTSGTIHRASNGFIGINTENALNALSINGSLSIASTSQGASLSAVANGLNVEVALGIGTSTITAPLSLSGGGITIDGIQQRYDRNAKVPLPHVVTSFLIAGDVQTSAFTVNRDGTPIFFYTLAEQGVNEGDKNVYALRCRKIDCSLADSPVIAYTLMGLNNKLPEILSAKPGPGDYPIVLIKNKSLFSTATRFLACTSLNCATNSSIVVDTNTQSADMIIGGDGNPVIISIRLGSGNPIKVIHCYDPACASKEDLTLISGAFDYLAFTLGINVFPIIAYQDGDDGNTLKFIRCRTTNCSASTNPVKLDDPLDWPSSGITVVGKLNAIVISRDGTPLIFHTSEGGNATLRVTKCDDISCSTPSTDVIKTFSSGVSVTSIRAATSVHGTPILIYSTTDPGNDNNNLYFIRCGNEFCGKDVSGNDEFKETRLVLTGADYFGLSPSEFYAAPGAAVFVGSHGLPLVGFINSISGSGLLTSFQCGSEFCVPYWTRR